MMVLDGKKVAEKITINLKKRIQKLNFKPKLTIIQVGNNPASNKYISYKIKKAHELLIETNLIKLNDNISESNLKNLVEQESLKCNGLIVQLPLPVHLNQQLILNSVPFEKDVDGLAKNNYLVTPATPLAVIKLLKAYNFEIKNHVISVIGQSNLVGKPLASLCEKLGAKKVYRFDKETQLDDVKLSEIVIVAIGVPKFIKDYHLPNNAVVVDVGINEIADENSMKKIVGDVDTKSVSKKVQALSLVPGGVGPMTVITLMENLVMVCEKYEKNVNK